MKSFQICLIVFFLLAWETGLGHGVESTSSSEQTKSGVNIQKIGKIVVFPLKNNSGNLDASSIMTSLLEEELKKKGFRIVPFNQVDEFLISKRVRDTSVINSVLAIELRRELEADAVLIGSIDQFSTSGDDIYGGLTLRLVEPMACSIIWMDTLAYAGKDFTGMLGFGTIKSIDKLSRRVVSEIIEGIPQEYEVVARGRGGSGGGGGGENFYEIGKVRATPEIAGGGKTVKLSARIISLNEKPPALVRVRIDGKMFDMHGDGEFYNAEIVTPLEDGLYPMDIAAFGFCGEASIFYSTGEIKIDMTAPIIELAADKDAMRGFSKKDHIKSVLIKEMSGKGKLSDKIKVSVPSKENVAGAKAKTLIYRFSAVDTAGNKFETSDQKLFIFGEQEKFAKLDEVKSDWGVADF